MNKTATISKALNLAINYQREGLQDIHKLIKKIKESDYNDLHKQVMIEELQADLRYYKKDIEEFGSILKNRELI